MLFLDIFDKISFGIISGIFMMVAKVYDLLLKIVHRTYTMDGTYFEQFATTVYVLAGVFMLFRTVIGLVQMLINPDQINDKQAGAGKIITRIITCIIMLMAFAPNGILFGQSGLFARMEEALLADDGLVTQFMNLSEQTNNEKIKNQKSNDFLIENVEAASKTKTLRCYYVNKKAQVWTNNQGTSGTGYRPYYYNIGYPIKIEFYSDSTTGKTGHINCNNGKCKYSYTVFSNQRVNGDDKLGYYGAVVDSKDNDVAITKGNVFNTDTFPSTCPKAFKEVNGHLAAQKNFLEHGNSLKDCGKNSGVTKTITTECWNSAKGEMEECQKTGLVCKNVGIQGGYKSYSELKKAVSSLELTLKGASASVASPSHFIQENTDTGKNDDTAPLKRYLDGVDSDAVVFAQGTASSLQECTTEKKEECAEAQHGKNNNGTDGMFKDTESNSAIVKLMAANDLDVGFIISVLTGIALIVYLLYLCIEVLVRKLKLYFLEMLAPLPIVCYINPKDKIFNQWLKMYMTTYADLFIKLISIGIAINLLAATFKDFWSSGGWLIKFFYIVAILVFAKLVPTMISKIFGLDSMGGSFKDIMGMGKAAAGFGAGAAIGAAAGLFTGAAGIASAKGWRGKVGAGLQGLGNAGSGFAKGMGSGWKGKPLAAGSDVLASGKKQRDARAQGATMAGLFKNRALNALGLDNPYMKEKDSIDKLKREKSNTSGALSSIKTFNDAVEDNMRKKSGDKGYENLQAVRDWRKAKANLAAAEQSGDSDAIYAATQAEQSAFKSAFDAAKDEELNRIAGLQSTNSAGELVKIGADVKASAAIESYDRYNEGLGKIGTESNALDHNELSTTKDMLTTLENRQSSEISVRETKLEESRIKAEHDATSRGK